MIFKRRARWIYEDNKGLRKSFTTKEEAEKAAGIYHATKVEEVVEEIEDAEEENWDEEAED